MQTDFTEVQRLTDNRVVRWLVLVLLILISLGLAYVLYTVLLDEIATASEKINIAFGFGLNIMFISLLVVLIYSIKLDTIIDGEGISYRFFPFARKRKIDFASIENLELVSYKPLKDYGGWGIRAGGGGKGTAYSMAGNEGLMIKTREGKKIMIGTQKKEELLKALETAAKDRLFHKKQQA